MAPSTPNGVAIAARARRKRAEPSSPDTRSKDSPPEQHQRLAVVLTGVSGSGKTTVAKIVAERLGWRFGEADELQPPLNVAKIKARIPLTDADRQPWLTSIQNWIDATDRSAVISCSALRRSYRERLLGSRAAVRFVELDGDFALIWPRLSRRPGAMMTASMLATQFAARDPMIEDDISARVWVDGDQQAVADRVQAVIERWAAELDPSADSRRQTGE